MRIHSFLITGLLSWGLSLSILADTVDDAVNNLRNQILDQPQEKVFVHMDKPSYQAGDTIWFRAHTLTAAFHLPSAMSRALYVQLLGPDGRMVDRFTLEALDKRLFSSFIVLSESYPAGFYTLKAYTERMQGKSQHEYFSQTFWVDNPVRSFKSIVDTSADIRVQFYPEGGRLLADQICAVSFRCESNKGEPVSISGTVYASNGRPLVSIETMEAGVGYFSLPVETGQSYYALLDKEDGKTQYVDLPYVYSDGYSLKLMDMGDLWYVEALEAKQSHVRKPLTVMCLQRGVPVWHLTVTPQRPYVRIPKSDLSSGFHVLILLDERNEVLSERGFYVHANDAAHVDLLRGDSIQPARLHLTSFDGKPLQAEVSVSIHREVPDSVRPTNSFVSYLQLESDWNVSVPNVWRLMDPNNQQAQMLLQAYSLMAKWSTYNIQLALEGRLEEAWAFREGDVSDYERVADGIYRPLTDAEKQLKADIARSILLKTVNVTPEAIEREIKPYAYANHQIKAEEILEAGVFLRDFLETLPGVVYDEDNEVLTIRGGNVVYLLDGLVEPASILNEILVSDIKSVDVLKDADNTGFVKGASGDYSNISNTGIGGVVAIWTHRAFDVKPQSGKSFVSLNQPIIHPEVRRHFVRGKEDVWLSQFPPYTVGRFWRPMLWSDANGMLQLPEGMRSVLDEEGWVLEVNGVTEQGVLIQECIRLKP